jgi:hypothetical protein
MASFGENDYDEESIEKPRNKIRSRHARSAKHRSRNNFESDEDDDSNPAEPASTKSPDSHTRRQEFLAKVAAAAGSKYGVKLKTH